MLGVSASAVVTAILNFPPRLPRTTPIRCELTHSSLGRCRTEFRQHAEVALDCAYPCAACGPLPSWHTENPCGLPGRQKSEALNRSAQIWTSVCQLSGESELVGRCRCRFAGRSARVVLRIG